MSAFEEYSLGPERPSEDEDYEHVEKAIEEIQQQFQEKEKLLKLAGEKRCELSPSMKIHRKSMPINVQGTRVPIHWQTTSSLSRTRLIELFLAESAFMAARVGGSTSSAMGRV